MRFRTNSRKNYTIHDLVMKRPASAYSHRWRDGTALGSGKTGVVFYGGTSEEHFIVNRNDLWYGGEDAPVTDMSYCLPKMRELMDQGEYSQANHYMYNELVSKEYGTTLADMRPLGIVNLKFNDQGIYNSYRRVLHMDTAEAEVTYKLGNTPYKRRYFMSRNRDFAVMEINAGEKSDFTLNCGFFKSNESDREKMVKTSDEATAKYSTIGESYIYSAENMGKFFGIVCRVISDGEVSIGTEGISVEGSRNAIVLIKAFSEEENREAAETKTAQILNGCNESYDKLFAENLPEYQRLYNSADIKLYGGEDFHTNKQLLEDARENEMSIELAEKLWRFGRYLFISGTAKDGLPFALYGLWAVGYELLFTHNVANENVQSIYWHTDVGGLSELTVPLINYYFNKMDAFRENARQLFGCRGIFVGTYTTPRNSAIACFVPVILHFCGVAGWLSQHFYKYYLYSADEQIFDEKILPFMLETAQFYEDFHYLDNNGKLVIYPGVSPENSPVEYNDKKIPHTMVVTKNSTIEIAILKELLKNLIEISEKRPELKEKSKKWEEILSILPEYLINEDGAAAEWIDTAVHDMYEHRHISHLYPLFPGTELEETGDKELKSVFKKALELRKFGSFVGWSMPHMSAVYSRLNEPEKAFDILNALIKVCVLDNFFKIGHDFRNMGITGFDCGDEYMSPVQFDATLGTVNAIQEMLLFTSPGLLRLLPACPKQFSEGSAELLFAGGRVNFSWDINKKECHGEIKAIRNVDFNFELPFGADVQHIKLAKDQVYKF